MPNIGNTDTIARKLLPIIYVIDTSGSMNGAAISSMNEAMRDCIDILRDISDENENAEIKIGVIQFGTESTWVTNGLVYLDDFSWDDLEADGFTALGSALKELNEKLSREAILQSEVGYKAPVIIFMSDGAPTDDWENELNEIKEKNKWFAVSTKICIAIGNEADKGVLAKLAGNKESVITVKDNGKLKELIRVVSVTTSQIGSKSRTDASITQEVLKEIKEEFSNQTDIEMEEITPFGIEEANNIIESIVEDDSIIW